MPAKEFTLEELIVKQQENKANRLAQNAENIVKITERASAAEGAEKARLEGLLQIHNNHKVILEAIDPLVVATERFNKQEENKAKLNK
jgi:regulator of extracellular matrix RemA (YlzA/DUF370 family)